MNTQKLKPIYSTSRTENLFFKYRFVLLLAFVSFVLAINISNFLNLSFSTHPGSLSKWFPWVCPFHFLTDLLCPGCGLTRSFMALIQGQIPLAFYYHPLGPFIHSGLIYLLFDFTLFKGNALKSIYSYFVSARLTSILILLGLITWTFYRNVN